VKNITRKWIVGLKRRPQNIPLLFLIVSCMVYTFNLTIHSDTSMYVNSQIIAFYVFLITVFSILAIFSFTNVFARRQKFKKLWMSTAILLILAQIVFNILFIQILHYETAVREHHIVITEQLRFLADSGNNAFLHVILLGVTLLLIIFMPVYHKLLLKIDTGIEDDEMANIDGDVIDIASEDI